MKARTRNRKLKAEAAKEKRELAQKDQSNPANWGEAEPLTAIKVRDHIFFSWYEKDFLDDGHLMAATQITRGFEIITYDVRVRISNPASLGGKGHSNPQSWTAWQVDCVNVYNDWWVEMGRYKLPGGLVRDMSIGWLGMNDARRKWKMRYGTVKLKVREGLELYCVVRGRGKKI